MELTFKHSGDMGDIIFSLPTIRALAGEGGILYLDPKGGKEEKLVQGTDRGDFTRLDEKCIESLKLLLEMQPYIKEVKVWKGEKVTYNLDEFRKHIKFNNLAVSHLEAFNLSHNHINSAWLEVDKPTELEKKKIIARSLRYHGNHIFWSHMKLKGEFDDACFVGFPLEHQAFESTFEISVTRLDTPTLLDVARVVAGADIVFCNQNVVHAIAEGMKKRLFNEVFRLYPAAVFERSIVTGKHQVMWECPIS